MRKFHRFNDNAPTFDKTFYKEVIKRDAEVSEYVATISATDMDDGINGLISPEECYTIRVRAYNEVPNEEHKQETEIDVNIRVIDSVLTRPYFTTLIEGPILLKESFMNFSSPVAVLEANSSIPNEPDIYFTLVRGDTEQTNSKNTFALEQSCNTANILLNKRLDFETVSEYLLTISAKNTYNLDMETVVWIQVLDDNDNIPFFDGTGTILEHEPPGTPIMQVHATDHDEQVPEDVDIGTVILNLTVMDEDEISHTTYTIISGNIDNAFKIDETIGQISVNKQLDCETIREYTPIVEANDGVFQDNTTVSITIKNVNDCAPRFSYMPNVKVQEEMIPSECLTYLTAYDPDIEDRNDPQNIRYSVVQEYEEFIEIDNTNGCLRLLKTLDRDPPHGRNMWQLIIIATDETGTGL
uniref:Cadherin domain-containing protein n=1 Tax=Anopheles epiroticus TaxID=199890 RepID=A0A182P1E6_9DIPT